MPNFRRGIGVALFVLCVSARPALAQVQAGDREISLSGVLISGLGKEKHSFADLELGFDYFVTRKWSWRVDLGVERTSDGAHASTETTVGAGAEWNFGGAEDKNAPFIGIEAEHMFDGPLEITAVTPYVGLRAFLSRSTSFDVSAKYEITRDDGHIATGLQLHLGFSFYIGKNPRK